MYFCCSCWCVSCLVCVVLLAFLLAWVSLSILHCPVHLYSTSSASCTLFYPLTCKLVSTCVAFSLAGKFIAIHFSMYAHSGHVFGCWPSGQDSQLAIEKFYTWRIARVTAKPAQEEEDEQKETATVRERRPSSERTNSLNQWQFWKTNFHRRATISVVHHRKWAGKKEREKKRAQEPSISAIRFTGVKKNARDGLMFHLSCRKETSS